MGVRTCDRDATLSFPAPSGSEIRAINVRGIGWNAGVVAGLAVRRFRLGLGLGRRLDRRLRWLLLLLLLLALSLRAQLPKLPLHSLPLTLRSLPRFLPLLAKLRRAIRAIPGVVAATTTN